MIYQIRGVKPFGIALLSLAMLAGCSRTDMAGRVRESLHSAGLNDISVSNDRDKGVMTLTGSVSSDSQKAQADSIAKSIAAAEVVSNQIAVIPPGYATRAKSVYSDLDQAIDKNLDAALIQADLHKGVSYSVKNGVVTLTGNVTSQQLRTQVQGIAAAVPNVQQVVNELQVKNQKASSTN
jgi:hyperosmotically inducible protein